MDKPLTLGYSPCPNDTYIFSAWADGLLPDAPDVQIVYEDIAVLNRMALNEELDIVKASFHAMAYLRETYALLRSGGALGRGCGPLVVTRERIGARELNGKSIAVPGMRTTALLLLRLFEPSLTDFIVMPFDEIMSAVRDEVVDAGLIIHESRFTYPSYGLRQAVDLGEWWTGETGLPIPLGGIAMRRSFSQERRRLIEKTIRASLEHARRDEASIWQTVRAHAQEMDNEAMRAHIELYVNDFSLDYGEEGEAAIRRLFDEAERRGVVPPSLADIF